ncbi:MAG: AraC family transcriptional regulator [Caldilineaceae bacterium]|nr:AraC family transcriptional regulator [Caldilineaceae bacterium]
MHSGHFVDWRLNRKAQTISPAMLRQARSHPLLASLYVRATGQITRGLGHHFERETIDEYIMLYCVEGRGWLRIGSQTYPIGPHDLCFVLTGHAHGYGADHRDPWTIHWAHFNGHQAAAFVELIGVSAQSPIISLRGDTIPNLTRHFNAMLSLLAVGALSEGSLLHLLKACAYLRQILSTLALINATVDDPPTEDAAEESVVERVIRLMHENITCPLQLEEMAREVNLSASHLHRLFRQEIDTTPMHYFICLKIERACELLDNTEMKVNEISHFLGYGDPHYFSRIFKQITGHAPRKFRTLRRAGLAGIDHHPSTEIEDSSDEIRR